MSDGFSQKLLILFQKNNYCDQIYKIIKSFKIASIAFSHNFRKMLFATTINQFNCVTKKLKEKWQNM